MKKFLSCLLVASALLACRKESPTPQPDPVPIPEIVFQLGASFSDRKPAAAVSKAVQEDWEEGNVIFVFFKQDNGLPQVSSPAHLEMQYLGDKKWSYNFYGELGIVNGNTGTMRAVYLPFGSDASIGEGDNDEYVFETENNTSFFLTATLPYTVTNNTVRGNFEMKVPAGYVQFYVADEDAEDGAYVLSTDAVTPVKVVSVSPDGSLNLEEKRPGDNMPGYEYKGGYLFSGAIVSDYGYGGNYYFAKTEVSDGTRSDFFIGDKSAFQSRKSYNLPANSSNKWQPVGQEETVTLSKTASGTTTNYGTWYTCNYGADSPDETGTRMDFPAALDLVDDTDMILPSYEQMNDLRTKLTWTPISVYRTPGWVVSDGSGFLFFPLDGTTRNEWYWTSTPATTERAWHLYLVDKGDRVMGESPTSMTYPARYMSSTQ